MGRSPWLTVALWLCLAGAAASAAVLLSLPRAIVAANPLGNRGFLTGLAFGVGLTAIFIWQPGRGAR